MCIWYNVCKIQWTYCICPCVTNHFGTLNPIVRKMSLSHLRLQAISICMVSFYASITLFTFLKTSKHLHDVCIQIHLTRCCMNLYEIQSMIPLYSNSIHTTNHFSTLNANLRKVSLECFGLQLMSIPMVSLMMDSYNFHILFQCHL